MKKKPAAIRKAYDKNDAIADLRAQISKSKAIDWLLHNSKFVDDKGNAIDTDTVLGDHNHDEIMTDESGELGSNDDAQEHDHDHNHDHKH